MWNCQSITHGHMLPVSIYFMILSSDFNKWKSFILLTPQSESKQLYKLWLCNFSAFWHSKLRFLQSQNCSSFTDSNSTELLLAQVLKYGWLSQICCCLLWNWLHYMMSWLYTIVFIGNELLKQDKFQDAIACYTKAIAIDGRNAVYFCNRLVFKYYLC